MAVLAIWFYRAFWLGLVVAGVYEVAFTPYWPSGVMIILGVLLLIDPISPKERAWKKD